MFFYAFFSHGSLEKSTNAVNRFKEIYKAKYRVYDSDICAIVYATGCEVTPEDAALFKLNDWD